MLHPRTPLKGTEELLQFQREQFDVSHTVIKNSFPEATPRLLWDIEDDASRQYALYEIAIQLAALRETIEKGH